MGPCCAGNKLAGGFSQAWQHGWQEAMQIVSVVPRCSALPCFTAIRDVHKTISTASRGCNPSSSLACIGSACWVKYPPDNVRARLAPTQNAHLPELVFAWLPCSACSYRDVHALPVTHDDTGTPKTPAQAALDPNAASAIRPVVQAQPHPLDVTPSNPVAVLCLVL